MQDRTANVAINIAGRDDTFRYESERKLPAASFIKLFILGAAADALLQNRLQASTRLAIGSKDIVQGSGILKYTNGGPSFTISELLWLMAGWSDNTATNKILGLLTVDAVQRFIDATSAKSTAIRVPMMPSPAESAAGINETSADDVALFYRLVSTGFPSPVHPGVAGFCAKILAEATHTFRLTDLLFSPVQRKIALGVLSRNGSGFRYYLRAARYESKKRLSLLLGDEKVLAEKSASGNTVFYDSCMIEHGGHPLIMATMIQQEGARFSDSTSEDHARARQFFSNIGLLATQIFPRQ
ncbi:serine hydrolase [Chitinophaga rhizosphaerae]|uniref:serine hydrolase n=1 Tax=Chitinophaga rhizosphaerae TaxID=1864947 RepID=UPI0013DFFDEB|nr:serine hydrolase [Chitinophaga rhizosphaerae]